MFDKVYAYVKKWVADVCHVLELIAAIFVFIAVVIALISLIPHVGELWENRSTTGAMLEFLEQVFLVVIGVEFLKSYAGRPRTMSWRRSSFWWHVI